MITAEQAREHRMRMIQDSQAIIATMLARRLADDLDHPVMVLVDQGDALRDRFRSRDGVIQDGPFVGFVERDDLLRAVGDALHESVTTGLQAASFGHDDDLPILLVIGKQGSTLTHVDVNEAGQLVIG